MLGWALPTMHGLLRSCIVLRLLCPCLTVENHTGMLLYHRKRDNISLGSQLSVLVVFRNIQEGSVATVYFYLCST